jgi:RNA polymerase sigma factor for flagellar operon FliA
MNKGYALSTRDPARERFIAEHAEMARRIALRVARRVPDWMSRDDLVGAAMVGLAEAAERFDLGRGEPFVAFAEKRIRGAVLDELRRGDIMPRRVRAEARRVGQTIRELEHKLGRGPEDHEVAAALGVSVQHYLEELEGLAHVSFVDLEPRRDSIPGEDGSPAQEAERRQAISRLRDAMKRLKERDALVLSLYYGDDLSYAEIGQILGVTESRVCQLHSRALARLRVELDPHDEEEGEDE